MELIRVRPCRRAKRHGPVQVRNVSGDVEGRHEMAALAGTTKRVRGALASAT